MSRYLNEIRLGKEKEVFRDMIHDIRRKFNLSSSKRPVPHITLFGPYNTSQGHETKHRTQSVLANYERVPYRVTDFNSFPDTGVVYAVVEPSEELSDLRRDLATALQPVTHDYQDWDTGNSYEFHITLATGLEEKHTRVLEYLRTEYDVNLELYAKRVTALDGREMMWEWDLPRGEALSANEATSRQSWKRTVTALQDQSTSHEETEQTLFQRLIPWF